MPLAVDIFFTSLVAVFLISASALCIAMLVRMARCKPAIFIRFRSTTVSDTTFPINTSETATAVIVDAQSVAVPGATFDAAPSWSFSDPSICIIDATSGQTATLTGRATGSGNLDVVGVYLGNTITGQALVTVTATPGGFGVTIQWQVPAPVVAKKA